MLQAPVYGKCEKLIESTILLALSAAFKLYPDQAKANLSSNTTKYRIENVAANLFPKLRRELKLVGDRCQLGFEYICGTFNGSFLPEMFAIEMCYTTTDKCQAGIIIERIQLFLQNGIKIRIENELVTLTAVALSALEYKQYKLNKAVKQGSFRLKGLLPVYDFQIFSRCPSVALNANHYTNLMKQAHDDTQKRNINSLFNLTALGSNVAPNGNKVTVHVCYGSYSSVLRQKNHGMSYGSSVLMVAIMAFIPLRLPTCDEWTFPFLSFG